MLHSENIWQVSFSKSGQGQSFDSGKTKGDTRSVSGSGRGLTQTIETLVDIPRERWQHAAHAFAGDVGLDGSRWLFLCNADDFGDG